MRRQHIEAERSGAVQHDGGVDRLDAGGDIGHRAVRGGDEQGIDATGRGREGVAMAHRWQQPPTHLGQRQAQRRASSARSDEAQAAGQRFAEVRFAGAASAAGDTLTAIDGGGASPE